MSATLYPDWREKIVFSAEGPQPQILVETAQLKSVLVGLMPGQKLPPHPGNTGVYHFLEGAGWMIVDDARFPVQAGATMVVPADAQRGIEAVTQLAFIGVRVP